MWEVMRPRQSQVQAIGGFIGPGEIFEFNDEREKGREGWSGGSDRI